MKTIITLALFALSFFSASAQFGQSVLNLRISDNSPFKVYIDGQLTSNRLSNSVKIDNLQPGKHMLQVVRVTSTWGHSYEEVVYGSGIVLSANTESWVTVLPELRKIKFDNIIALNKPVYCPPVPGPNFYPVRPGANQCTTDAPVFVPTGPCAMNVNDFEQLKQTIDNAGFESTRLTIFKQALTYNYFTTAQVRQLMDLFWFESSKLEVAKAAYAKTVDQNNYYLVNNEFGFSSSVNALGDYIAMR